MNDIQHIITERVDDVPLLLEQMKRMELPTLIDQYFPAHGNWYGLSLGWVSTIWLSSIVSRGDHRLAHVEPWVANRLLPLKTATNQKVERLDFTDDHLEIVLRHFSDDSRWVQFESHLNQHTVRVYDLRTARVHVDSTTASVYASVSEEGLLQFGPSKDHRPDLPQVKVMQAVLDPLGMPLATDVVSGERADDPLYVPCIQRVQASLSRSGLLFVGDGKMVAQDTRTFIALAGDYYLCPLPQGQLAEGELDEALARVWSGEQGLSAVWRAQEHGAPQLIAQGYEHEVPMSVEVEGRRCEWSERRLIVRSVRHADAAEVALRARVAKAKAQVEALNRRGRGRTRFEDIEPLRQAVNAIVQRHCVEDFLWFRYDHCTTMRPMYVQRDDHATGLIRLLSIALRVLTLLECVVRRQLAAAGETLAGLYAGNSQRETARPTAERLLEAFQEVTLTVIAYSGDSCHPIRCQAAPSSEGSRPRNPDESCTPSVLHRSAATPEWLR